LLGNALGFDSLLGCPHLHEFRYAGVLRLWVWSDMQAVSAIRFAPPIGRCEQHANGGISATCWGLSASRQWFPTSRGMHRVGDVLGQRFNRSRRVFQPRHSGRMCLLMIRGDMIALRWRALHGAGSTVRRSMCSGRRLAAARGW
jgi:hypothetical protein